MSSSNPLCVNYDGAQGGIQGEGEWIHIVGQISHSVLTTSIPRREWREVGTHQLTSSAPESAWAIERGNAH